MKSSELDLPDFAPLIAALTRDFTGRDWVFDKISQWLARSETQTFFLITGEPGIGKSAIAARLTQLHQIAAMHFCIARRADTIDPLIFVRSLAVQLSRFDRFARALLLDSNLRIESSLEIKTNYGQAIGLNVENLIVNMPSAVGAFQYAVLQPLKVFAAKHPERTYLFVIDGLDEAVQYTGPETIVDLLANMGEVPSNIRFVVTSRPEGTTLRHFQERGIPHLLVSEGRRENVDDVKEFIRQRSEVVLELQARLVENRLTPEVFVRPH